VQIFKHNQDRFAPSLGGPVTLLIPASFGRAVGLVSGQCAVALTNVELRGGIMYVSDQA
jgi:hypothetical protein